MAFNKKAAYGLAAAAVLFSAARGMQRRFSLKNKVVAITGGSRGLGLALAQEFAKRGARLAVCGRNEETLARARTLLQTAGFQVYTYPCDVRIRQDVERFVHAVLERYGALDVLVNNAGTIQYGPMTTMTQDDYKDAMETHFWGAYYATEAVLPVMRRKGAGRLVNIASIGGLVSVPHLLPYNASKFALVGYSEGLHAELARFNICVTTICPGLMRSGSPRNAFFKGKNVAEYAIFSLMGTSPFTSMNARRAAHRVVKACMRGEPRVVLSHPAYALAVLHSLFPNAVQSVFAFANALLPKEGGIDKNLASGAQSASPLSESVLTALGKKAEIAFNQR
ncbi:MAG: SDR family NAD(P)-dependent oxidoreductase [Candidatus Eremiobacteraeota bacterium]|nr:SDR family NAD(P)-dependent oxidoreductase [Candidatus Eremiobacteraeota bacterium]